MDVIGENLKNLRLSLNLTRKEFVKDIIDSSYLAHIENNKNEVRAITLVKLLDQNNVSVLEFLKSYGNTEKKMRCTKNRLVEHFLIRMLMP